MDLAIKNAKLISKGEEMIRNIYISRGKIKDITLKNYSAKKKIDARYNFVIPGIIDPHVHFREPGLAYKEDFFTGSMAAAAGGITTFFDMPNTIPPTLTYFDTEEKRFLAKKSLVNYGFYIGASNDNLAEIKKANFEGNVPGTKLFMNLSTGKMMIENRDIVRQVFRNSRLVAVHAEGPKVEEAIQYAIKTGTKLYLCHISTADEIETIKKYRDESEWVARNVFVEVTPHHLFLTEKDFKEQGSFAKMIPSLKTAKDQQALWDAIADGTADTIGTDHAPHTLEEKKGKEPPSGVTGEETMLALMLDAMSKGRVDVGKIVELTSRNPARIFSVKNKGRIAVGYDADLAVIDTSLVREVRNEELRTKCRHSPFNGWKLKGWPVVTIVNGKRVFDHGKIFKNNGKEARFDGK